MTISNQNHARKFTLTQGRFLDTLKSDLGYRYFSTQKLSPIYSPETKHTLQWNGLPEKQKNDLFSDAEHADDFHTKV